MTTEQIETINDLQQRGLGYKKIAVLTGLPVNSVKTYCRRNKVNILAEEEALVFCRECEKPIQRIQHAKPRLYCSDACRMRFWNSHRDLVRHRAIYTFCCPYCGREFQSFGNPNRKYCSRKCVADARRKDGVSDGC